MSFSLQATQSSFRGNKTRNVCGCVAAAQLCGALASLLLAIPAQGQEPDAPPPVQEPHAPPAGLRLNSASAYVGGDWLSSHYNQNDLPDANLWLVTGGATADVAWQLLRRGTEASLSYHVGYNRNQRYAALNGFDHILSFDLRTDTARNTFFTLNATGESGLMSDALLDPRSILLLSQHATSARQLADGLLDNNATAILDSPLELALSGARRRVGTITAGITHAFSRRLTSNLRIGAARELHSFSQEQLMVPRYPNVTIGMADLDISYSLSRRTRIIGNLAYSRSYTQQYRAEWESAGMGVERMIGRASFAYVQAGYARMSQLGDYSAVRNSYTVSGAVGTTKGNHTLAATFRRGLGDLHGLGTENTVAFEGAWSWAPRASSWSVGSSLGYEQLGGGTLETIRAWVYQASAVRRLTPHFSLAFASVYMTDSVPDVVGLTRRGLRVSLVWTPRLDNAR